VSEVEARVVTTHRHEFAVPSGAPYVELLKAIEWAKGERASAMPDVPCHDDTFVVTARDDEVVVWFERGDAS
jgi:hypothetical protein